MKRKPESDFANTFATVSRLQGLLFVPIPDMIPTRTRVQSYRNGSAPEARKPFDGVLITPEKTYCIEFKHGSNPQSDDQLKTEKLISQVNQYSYYVVRRKNLARGEVLTIEQYQNVVFETKSIVELVCAFYDKRCKQWS
jgi:hypothetical protein